MATLKLTMKRQIRCSASSLCRLDTLTWWLNTTKWKSGMGNSGYARQSRNGRKIASTVYLRERKDRAARRLARDKKRSKSSILVEILEDHLP